MPSLSTISSGVLLWVAGGWFFASVFMSVAASGNFRIFRAENLREASRLVKNAPEGPNETQTLRYFASEVNRAYFQTFNTCQAAIAVFALVLAVLAHSQGRGPLYLVGFSLVICLILLFYFTPKIIEIGRAIDFIPRDTTPRDPKVVEFYRLHGIYVWFELAKMAALLGTAFLIIRRTS